MKDIDWSRANRTLWDHRALVAGKVNISKNNVTLVTNVIVRTLGMALTPDAQTVEDLYAPAAMPMLRAAS